MPGTPTTKYGIPTLAGSTLARDIDTEVNAALTAIDSKFPGYSSGTLASRPTSTGGTPGIAGRRYRATDTGQEFIDTGTSWVEIASVAALPTLVYRKSYTLSGGADTAALGPSFQTVVSQSVTLAVGQVVLCTGQALVTSGASGAPVASWAVDAPTPAVALIGSVAPGINSRSLILARFVATEAGTHVFSIVGTNQSGSGGNVQGAPTVGIIDIRSES